MIACLFGGVSGLIATVGMLLAAVAFTTARTIVIPFIATFEGFHDSGGTNAVTVTGSWAMAGALTIALTIIASFFVLRHLGSSPSATPRPE
ncbi:hypothetical protein AKH00_12290 [Microbacterium sp. GCS4]|nr:hypothetical protein AKH00_12290 [Microbacterium sp. GCS4]